MTKTFFWTRKRECVKNAALLGDIRKARGRCGHQQEHHQDTAQGPLTCVVREWAVQPQGIHKHVVVLQGAQDLKGRLPTGEGRVYSER